MISVNAGTRSPACANTATFVVTSNLCVAKGRRLVVAPQPHR